MNCENMNRALTISIIAALLGVAVAALWAAHSLSLFLGNSSAAVQSVGSKVENTLDKVAISVDKVSASASSATDSTSKAAEEVIPQARLFILSMRGMSHDVRKNYTANVEFQTSVQAQFAGTMAKAQNSMDSVAASIERISLSIAALTKEVGPPAAAVLHESTLALQTSRDELKALSGSLQSDMDKATVSGTHLMDQASASIKLADPIIEDGGRISEAAAKVAEHYEKKWTRGSGWDKFKLILSSILYGLNLYIRP